MSHPNAKSVSQRPVAPPFNARNREDCVRNRSEFKFETLKILCRDTRKGRATEWETYTKKCGVCVCGSLIIWQTLGLVHAHVRIWYTTFDIGVFVLWKIVGARRANVNVCAVYFSFALQHEADSFGISMLINMHATNISVKRKNDASRDEHATRKIKRERKTLHLDRIVKIKCGIPLDHLDNGDTCAWELVTSQQLIRIDAHPCDEADSILDTCIRNRCVSKSKVLRCNWFVVFFARSCYFAINIDCLVWFWISFFFWFLCHNLW